ncbi:hypothetical protein HanRHA438_Chr09g0395421 [Helianthus annuus]|nr:hypothetical protein HanRHA438_Chr09g0395421 [Helianthus annuus]
MQRLLANDAAIISSCLSSLSSLPVLNLHMNTIKMSVTFLFPSDKPLESKLFTITLFWWLPKPKIYKSRFKAVN